MYTSDFFNLRHRWHSTSNKSPLQSYHITHDMINKIKTLVAHHSDESGYYNNMLQWRLEDNENLSEKELNDLYPAMQFITMTCKVDDDFIKKYDVKDWQISLLKRLYLDWDDEESCITMAFKRPFGNSHVVGDVREEMIRHGDTAATQRDLDEEDSHTEEELALNQFVHMLEKLFREGAYHLPVTAFQQSGLNGPFNYDPNKTQWPKYLHDKFRLHSHLYDWDPDISHQRDEKLEQLGIK